MYVITVILEEITMYNEKETKEFVRLWNDQNGYEQGDTAQANMRYVEPDLVTWNEYGAATIELSEFQKILNRIKQ
jgi:hypothetical protein